MMAHIAQPSLFGGGKILRPPPRDLITEEGPLNLYWDMEERDDVAPDGRPYTTVEAVLLAAIIGDLMLDGAEAEAALGEGFVAACEVAEEEWRMEFEANGGRAGQMARERADMAWGDVA